jgi:predicted secreted protein
MLLDGVQDLIIKRNNAVICAGIASKKLKYNGERIIITSDDDNGFETSLASSGTRSLDIALEGVEKDGILQGLINADNRMLTNVIVEYKDGDIYYGSFFLANFETDYKHDDAVKFSAELKSSGVLLAGSILSPPPSIVWPDDSLKTENLAIAYLDGVRGFQYLHEKKGPWTYIDDLGAIGPNKTTPTAVRYQRECIWVLRNGLIIGDEDYVLRASSAFEWAFDFQHVDGYFENGLGVAPVLAIESDVFFINGFVQAYRVIAGEPLLAGLAASYAAYATGLAASLAWMQTNTAQIYDDGEDTPNRLFFAAVSFNIGGRILANTTYRATGISFATAAVAMLHEDGYFLEKDGWDSSYQAVSMMNLCTLFFHTVDASFKVSVKAVLEIATDWLITRIGLDGEVSTEGNTRTGPDAPEAIETGSVKLVNYGEVALSLYYAGFILERLDLVEIANRVVRYAAMNS